MLRTACVVRKHSEGSTVISNENAKRHREHINAEILYLPFTTTEINITLNITGKVVKGYENLTNCPDLGEAQPRLLDFVSCLRE